MSGPREGYPVVSPEHPLFAAQQDGWPDHLPHEAWAAVAAHEPKRSISSANHPAFMFGYLGNTEATRSEQKPVEPVEARPPPKERR